MSGSSPFSGPEKINPDALSIQFYDTSVYTDARTELYKLRADPKVDFLGLGIGALQLTGDEHILETGCGKGGFSEMLDSLGYKGEITSADVSPHTFEATAMSLADKSNFKFVQADACDLPFPDNHFQGYASFNLLHAISDPLAAILEAKRVTKPGAILTFAIRGPENFARHAETVDKLLVDLDFIPVGSPYAHFGSEDALEVLGKYFEIIPERSYPQDTDASSVRQMKLVAEDWSLYSYSIYGTARAAILVQMGIKANALDSAIPRQVQDKLNELKVLIKALRPEFEAEIEENGFYHETAQDRLITCINTKEDLSLAA